jgi:hypothetical protein
MKMSSSMGIYPIYNNIQNTSPIKLESINYNYQVPNRIQIPQNKLFSKNNSSSFLSIQEKKILPDLLSSTFPKETKDENITAIIENPQPIRIQKKIFKRMIDLSKPTQVSTTESDLIENTKNFEKLQKDSNKINILDDEKNNFSLLDIKPIEKIVPSASQIIPQRKNNFNNIMQPLTTRNKILGKNLNKNMNKYIHDDYFTNIDNGSNINVNSSVEFNNRNNNLLLNSYKSENDIKNLTLDKKLNQSINNLNDFTNLNKTDNSIKKIVQKKIII